LDRAIYNGEDHPAAADVPVEASVGIQASAERVDFRSQRILDVENAQESLLRANHDSFAKGLQ